MEIPSFQQDDTGGYECVAENKMGKNTAAGRLAFYGTVTLVYFVKTTQLLSAVKLHAHTYTQWTK